MLHCKKEVMAGSIKSFEEYQAETDATAIYDRSDVIRELSYLSLGLNGEAGEVADKVKKVIRDDGGNLSAEHKDALAKELGDVLWYLTQLSRAIGTSLEAVAVMNIKKLAERKKGNTLRGSGDDR